MKFRMGIVKIEIKIPELVKALEVFKADRKSALEMLSIDIRNGVSDFMNQHMHLTTPNTQI